MVNIQFDLKLKKLLIKVGFYLYKFSFFLSNAIFDNFSARRYNKHSGTLFCVFLHPDLTFHFFTKENSVIFTSFCIKYILYL